jgi:hypothetical protein
MLLKLFGKKYDCKNQIINYQQSKTVPITWHKNILTT